MGTGERNERIRTYNFPQNRITDHRVGVSKFDIEKMLNGELLGEFTEALMQQERLELIEQLENQAGSDSSNSPAAGTRFSGTFY